MKILQKIAEVEIGKKCNKSVSIFKTIFRNLWQNTFKTSCSQDQYSVLIMVNLESNMCIASSPGYTVNIEKIEKNLKNIYNMGHKTILLQNYLFGNINGDKNSRKIQPNNVILYFSNEFELKRYICFSCNIKRYKTTAKFSENSWNKRRSKFFKRRHLWRQHLYCYRFFLLLNRNQVPEMLYFGQWPYITKINPVNVIWLLK